MAAVQIGADELLYRRIFGYYRKPDGTIASSAFKTRSKKPEPECSVYVARLTTADAVLAAGMPDQLLIGLPASVPLGMGLDVRHAPRDPNPGTLGYAHAVIVGLTTNEQCDRLAAASFVV